MKKNTTNSKQGFTLLEILLVVGIISILAGIVILAINPTKQLGDTRNAQRRSDILTILNAVYQYSIDNNGALPTEDGDPESNDVILGNLDSDTACDIDHDASEIVRVDEDGNTEGGTGVDLWPSLVESAASSTYLVAIPADPSRDSDEGTGYHIFKTAGGRITVCAPHAENSADISVTR